MLAGQSWSSASEGVTFSIAPERVSGKSRAPAIKARQGDDRHMRVALNKL